MSVLNLKNPHGQRMLTKAIFDKIPNLYEQDGKGEEAIVHVKYFTAGFTWYVTEMNPETGEAFGKVYSEMCPDGELGYISLTELASIKVRRFVVVERDQHFEPKPLKECKNPCNA